MSQKAVSSSPLRSEIERKTNWIKTNTSWNIWKGQQNSPPYGTMHPKTTTLNSTRFALERPPTYQNYSQTLDPATSKKTGVFALIGPKTSQKKHQPPPTHRCWELYAHTTTGRGSRITQNQLGVGRLDFEKRRIKEITLKTRTHTVSVKYRTENYTQVCSIYHISSSSSGITDETTTQWNWASGQSFSFDGTQATGPECTWMTSLTWL